jgi:hypothetical protein
MMNLMAIADKIEKKSIEQYAHKGRRSVNNPPVGGRKKRQRSGIRRATTETTEIAEATGRLGLWPRG